VSSIASLRPLSCDISPHANCTCRSQAHAVELARVARLVQRHMAELEAGAGKAQALALDAGDAASLSSLEDEAQHAEGAFGAPGSGAASPAGQRSPRATPPRHLRQHHQQQPPRSSSGAGRAGSGVAVVSPGDLEWLQDVAAMLSLEVWRKEEVRR